MVSHEDSVFAGGLNWSLLVILAIEDTVARGALGWLVAWPGATVVVPAWWVLLELPWAINNLVVDSWIVPVEALEVLAAFFQGAVLESVAITVLLWILTVDHPVRASLWSSQSTFHAHLVAGV